MQTTILIVSEREDSYTGKKGKVEQTIVACLDRCKVCPMVNTFDYVLTEEERAQHKGKLSGQTVLLNINNIEPAFGGRLRARGVLVLPEQAKK